MRVNYWGGGGAKGMLAPSQIIGGGLAPPVPTPMMYQNNSDENIGKVETQAKTRISLRICAV